MPNHHTNCLIVHRAVAWHKAMAADGDGLMWNSYNIYPLEPLLENYDPKLTVDMFMLRIPIFLLKTKLNAVPLSNLKKMKKTINIIDKTHDIWYQVRLLKM